MIDLKLIAGLHAPEEAERRASAAEIAECDDPAALTILLAQLGKERSRAVKEAILRGISGLKPAGANAAIVALLRDDDPFVRAEASAILQHRVGAEVESWDSLVSLLRSSDQGLRKFAIEILGQATITLPDPFYAEALKDEDTNVVICVIERIGSARRTSLAGAVLALALGEGHPHAHPMLLCSCLDALALIGTVDTLARLRERFTEAIEVPNLFLPAFLKLLGLTAGPEGMDEICRAISARGVVFFQPAVDALTRLTTRHRLDRLSSSSEETLCGLLSADLDGQSHFHLVRLLGHFSQSERVALALLPGLHSPDALLRLLTVQSLARAADPGVDVALRSMPANEADPETREELKDLLGRRLDWNSHPNSSPG